MSGGAVNPDVADLHKELLPVNNDPGRSKSFPGFKTKDEKLKVPGGFRRDFLNQKADAEGVPWHARPEALRTPLMKTLQPLVRANYFEHVLDISETGEKLARSQGELGKLGVALALLKGFVGSGITFMPGAFLNGGWLLSCIALVLIGLLNGLCIRLLLDCRDKLDASSYGDIAARALGRAGELAVQISLILSQFGTCIAFMVFVLKNGVSLGMGSPQFLVAVQLVFLIPLCLVRNLHQLEAANLLADFLTMSGLFVMVVYFVMAICIDSSHDEGEVQPYNLSNFALFFGAAMQALEGIPTVLPVRLSMREPKSFWGIFLSVFAFVVFLYLIFGLAGYICFGPAVQTPVLLNLPKDALWAKAVKLAYMLALVLSIPIFFVPVTQLTEFWAFGITKKGSRTWGKNAIRATELILFGLIAIVGASSFERFLGFVGGACATPIAFVYPPLLHFLLCAETFAAKAVDIAITAFGVFCVVFVVLQSV